MFCRPPLRSQVKSHGGVRVFSPRSALRSPLCSPAFTFIEVLFAIIILGIGSIMIAGMLPVAIKQSSDTRNAITGKAACEAGYAYVQAIATASNLPATNVATNKVNGTDFSTALSPTAGMVTFLNNDPNGQSSTAGKMLPLVYSIVHTGAAIEPLAPFGSLVGSRVLSSDPRSQWLAFYSRASGSPTAKLVVLGLHLQNVEQQQSYAKINDATSSSAVSNGFNDPLQLTAEFAEGGALDPDTVRLTGTTQALNAADTGAFLIVADSPATVTERDRPFRNNGRVFQLGKLVSSTSSEAIYELQPGYDLPPLGLGTDNLPNTADDVADASMGTGQNTLVWLVGKGLQNQNMTWNQTSNPYVGLVQDVGVLTTQVQLSN